MRCGAIKRSAKKSAVLGLCLSLVFPVMALCDSALPAQIEVIHDHHNRITGIQAIKDLGIPLHLYNLNAPDVLLDQLGKNLPPQIERAKQVLFERFEAIGHKNLKLHFISAYQGVIKSTAYGLDRYPAVVFNQGEAVVYGVTDLRIALAQFQTRKTPALPESKR